MWVDLFVGTLDLELQLVAARHSCSISGCTVAIRGAPANETPHVLTDDASIRLRPNVSEREDIIDTLREPLLVLDASLRVCRANRSFCEVFKVAQCEAESRLVFELGNGQWDTPALRRLLEESLPSQSLIEGFEVTYEFPSIGRKVMLLNARRILGDSTRDSTILLAFEDVTERRRLEDERLEIKTRFTSLLKNVRDHLIFSAFRV